MVICKAEEFNSSVSFANRRDHSCGEKKKSHLRRAVSPGGYLNCGCPKSFFSINALFLCEVGGKGRWMVNLS